MAHSNSAGPRKGSRYHRLDDIPTNTFTPRTYQIQLLDAALKRSTLLCLGCAQSKVFLSLMVAKELASVTRLPLDGGGKRAFYLTDSEDELEELSQTLPHHTDLRIGQCPSSIMQDTNLGKLSHYTNIEGNLEISPDNKEGSTNSTQISISSTKTPDDCRDAFCHRKEETTSSTKTSSFREETPKDSSELSPQCLETLTTGASREHHLWQQLLESSNILICHGSVFVEAVRKNYVRLKDVSLLIFDDCHRSVEEENHPYAEIISYVKNIPFISQPHILGVTASIAGTECSDPSKLKETISSMEETMHAYAETSMLILSERFGCRPKEWVVQCDDEWDDEQASLREMLEDILGESYDFFYNCRITIDDEVDNRDPKEIPMQVLSQCLTILNILGSWCTSSVSEYFVMQLEKIVKCEKNDIHKKFLRCVITTLRGLIKVFEKNFHPDYDVDELLEYTTSKVRELVRVLRNYKPEVDFMIISNDDNYEDNDDFSDLSDDDDDESDMSGSEGDDESGVPSNKSSLNSKPMHIAIKRTADGGHERIMTFPEEEEKNLCGIVFVENRYIAFGLNKVIEEICSWDENLCFVKSCHITGQGFRGAGGKQKANRTYKRQEEALRKFRTQECNLVIATLELEEGIDIPKCNLVVRFDPPRDYRSYTLSKGRARARDASYVILADEENNETFSSSLKVFKGIEQVLLGENRRGFTINTGGSIEQSINLQQNVDDSDEDENDDDEDFDEEDLLPPYRTIPNSPTSPQVTMQGAIALINRYCAKLPSDAFTHLTPQCKVEKTSGNPCSYVAHLRLPINSPVKEGLRGPRMKSRKLAKMAVALKMCEILHSKSELDENLVPVGKEMFLYEEEEEEEWADEEDLAGQARPGTTKRKQYYNKKAADALVQSHPRPGEKCYLYLINLRLTGPITDEQNTRGRVIYAPEDTHQTLGLLLSKPIPQMPYFPVYTRSGEVTASVDLLCTDLIFSEEEISHLLKFHHFVFSGVLHLEKDPMEFDPAKADCGCVVVPLNGEEKLEIDWDFVEKVIHFMKIEKRAGFSKKNKDEHFHFCINEFKDAVVMPSYRNIDQPQHFYVAEIRRDLNPLSPFPSPELYKTFQDYYTTKYGLMITSTDQPLLDVDHTSARLNLLTPRYMNQKGVALPTSSAETKRARRENLQQKQILVPELCDVHVFPASLWRKTVCLPAILYRTNCLMLAEELRRKIAKETAIGCEELPDGFRFPQLDFGFETSPEKLKEAESNSSKKSTSSPPSDVKCVGQKSRETKAELSEPENSKARKSPVPKMFEGEADNNTLSCQNRLKTPPTDDEMTQGADRRMSQEKTDSSASSDSDSGIVSSGSDTNIGIQSKIIKTITTTKDQIPDVNAAKIAHIAASNQTKGLDHSLTSSWCSDDPNVCKTVTPQGSSVPSNEGNHHNQCNIYTMGANTPLSSSVNGQQDGSSISTSSVIMYGCNSFNPDTTAPAMSLPVSVTKDTGSPASSSVTHQATNIVKYTSDEVCSSTMVSSVHTSAQGSDNDKKSPAAHNDTGAKSNAAIAMPCSTSFTSLSSSSSLSPLFSLSPVTPLSSSNSSLATVEEDVSETDKGQKKIVNTSTSCTLSKSSCNKLFQSSVKQTSSCGNICNDIDKVSSSPSTTAANEVSTQQDMTNDNTKNPKVELQNNLGCDSSMGQADPHFALLKDTYHTHEYGRKTCITDVTLDSNSSQPITISNEESSVCSQLAQNPGNDLDSTTRHGCDLSSDSKKVFEIQKDGQSLKNNDSIARHVNSDQFYSNGHGKTGKKCNFDITSHEFINSYKVSSHMDSNQKPIPTTTSPYSSPVTDTSQAGEDSAIIMNTLGQELVGLDIDLIIPQAETSETFQSSDLSWGVDEKQNQKQQKTESYQGMGKEDTQKSDSRDEKQKNYESKHSKTNDNEQKETASNDFVQTDKDSEVIKFSFNVEDKEEKKASDITIDKWSLETDENVDKSHGKKEPSHSTLNSQLLSSPKSSVPSPVQTPVEVSPASQTKEPKRDSKSFDIGIWNKKKNRNNQMVTDNYISASNGCISGRLSQCNETEISQSESPSVPPTDDSQKDNACSVSLDEDRDLKTFIGPSPCLILQALTMSNANDFFSLERLETIGDSFLKYAITVYLYCSYPGIHEGKLSYLRSKQVSNYNLYRLGRRKCLAECMVSTKFEPYENWLPPGFIINEERRRGPVPKVVIVTPGSKVTNASRNFYLDESSDASKRDEALLFNKELEWIKQSQEADQLDDLEPADSTKLTPYSLQRHHGLPDKSVADCVEALIGCYLTTCGRKAALMFMSWLGLKVLPKKKSRKKLVGGAKEESPEKSLGWKVSEQEFDELRCPPSPMFSRTPENKAQLDHLLQGFDSLEEKICYKFRDRSYLLQAFTHASYHYNTITDCYQRVEFLGDAILDYVITRHLYEDSQKYSPGILTDLRSALVNNNIFAALAVKWGFHKYFKAISPSLFHVIDKFVKRQKEKNQDDIDIDEEYRELSMEEGEMEENNEEEDEEEEVEMEIPKALGDIFESVAGAIYLDSGMSLDAVWTVYYRMMKPHIDKYLKSIPKSPVRELLETEPETAKFERPERTMNGKVRVTVNVVGKGVFSGVGRNYRIAKSAAAKKALRSLRIMAQKLVG